MKIALLAALIAISGCSTVPMTEEEKAQNERTIQALQLLNGQFNKPRQTGPQTAGTAFLKNSYQSGMNRICLYDRLGSQEAITIGSTELCPLTR